MPRLTLSLCLSSVSHFYCITREPGITVGGSETREQSELWAHYNNIKVQVGILEMETSDL